MSAGEKKAGASIGEVGLEISLGGAAARFDPGSMSLGSGASKGLRFLFFPIPQVLNRPLYMRSLYTFPLVLYRFQSPDTTEDNLTSHRIHVFYIAHL